MKQVVLFIHIFICSFLFSQNVDQTVDALIKKINLVKDYSVHANIKADIALIRVLPVNASIYFKQKDKFKVVSKGIAILPKQGFTDVTSFLLKKSSYMAVDGGTKTIEGITTHLVTVIPTVDNSEIVLAKLYVDTKRDVILKTELTTRGSGTVVIKYTYGAQVDFGLPDEMTFTIDIKKFKMPKSVAADISNSNKDKSSKDKSKEKTGVIVIKLTDYKVNKGINDDVFKKKD